MSDGAPVTIRPARPEDAAAIARIRVDSWRDTYAHVLSPEYLEALDPVAGTDGWRGTIERMTEDPSLGTFVVAEVDGAVRGFAIAGVPRPLPGETPPREWQLFLIYQDAALHGTGSGQALIEASIGDRPAHLWTAEDNPRAIAFYRRNGFVPDGERTSDPTAEGLAEIRMVR
jgi:ribosomal protein S18 acetylase RimI-like enzyme